LGWTTRKKKTLRVGKTIGSRKGVEGSFVERRRGKGTQKKGGGGPKITIRSDSSPSKEEKLSREGKRLPGQFKPGALFRGVREGCFDGELACQRRGEGEGGFSALTPDQTSQKKEEKGESTTDGPGQKKKPRRRPRGPHGVGKRSLRQRKERKRWDTKGGKKGGPGRGGQKNELMGGTLRRRGGGKKGTSRGGEGGGFDSVLGRRGPAPKSGSAALKRGKNVIRGEKPICFQSERRRGFDQGRKKRKAEKKGRPVPEKKKKTRVFSTGNGA